MSAIATAWAKVVAKENPRILPSDKRALMCLARSHTVKHGFAARSYADISAETMDCKRTVVSSVSRLMEYGLVSKQQQRNGKRQGANRYLLNFGIIRVQICTLMDGSSECNHETPDLVQPLHPEETLQSANLHHPTRVRARAKTETSGFMISVITGGRKHA